MNIREATYSTYESFSIREATYSTYKSFDILPSKIFRTESSGFTEQNAARGHKNQ
jgi:hypothetical protein